MKQSVHDDPTSPTPSPTPKERSGLAYFAAALLALIVMRLAIGLVPFPAGVISAVSLVVSVLFIAIPVLGFYRGASHSWNGKQAAAMIVGGLALWFVLGFAQQSITVPLLRGVMVALSQTGLLVWTFGLGTAIALFLKDKNLLLPMAVFLGLFDIWLVFAPEGIANSTLRGARPAVEKAFRDYSYNIPAPKAEAAGGFAQPLAYVGPADWLFIAMFFVALYRFRMRTRETFVALVPTLAAYLLVVLLFGNVEIGPFRLGALPALLPIGAVVLAVNWREFKLTKDEVMSTIAVLVIGVAVVTWRMVVSHNALEKQAEPSQSAPGPEEPRRQDLPPPA